MYAERQDRLTCALQSGFDVDSCCVGFDGVKVYALPRAATEIKARANTVDMTRRSYSYEHRLIKYAKRGYVYGRFLKHAILIHGIYRFSVRVPGHEPERIIKEVQEARLWRRYSYKGLAKLLIVDRSWKEWKETGAPEDHTLPNDRLDKVNWRAHVLLIYCIAYFCVSLWIPWTAIAT